ncbi:MAG: AbgT family transporter [Balneolales bacterium]
MSDTPEQSASSPRSLGQRIFSRALDSVERIGNKLPDPITLFVIFVAIVMIVSALASAFNVSAIHPGTGEEVNAVNLFSKDNLQRIFLEMPQTFAEFPPLGLVLVVMLGIGVADKTNLIGVALSAFVSSVPGWLLSASVVFAGLMSSLAVDAGYVVLIPLGAVIFHGVGRHPLAGLAAAFAGVSAGFSSNLFLTSLDPLLASFTTPAANILDPNYVVDVTANYYVMVALVPIFTITGAFVTEKIIEPRLGAYEEEEGLEVENNEISSLQRRGLWAALIVLIITLIGIAFMVVPQDAVLRGDDGSLGPFYRSIVALMLFLFLLPGLAYGIVTKQITSDKQVARMTSDTMASMGPYIVLAFAAAHFIAFFNWSNLGIILAIGGADLLQGIGFTGVPLIFSFIIVSAMLNLFIGSASAKWAVMAPVFVPMLMLLGYSPELTQALYRVGDSFTNVLTPLLPYFPLIIIFAQKYQKNIGIGTIISTMLPYSIAYGIVGITTIILWILFDLPLGPESPMYYQQP